MPFRCLFLALLLVLVGCGNRVEVVKPLPPPPCADAGTFEPCTVNGAPGTCQAGECCAGCWAGPTCRPEPSTLACGAAGSLCEPCDGAEMCINGACTLNPP